jgi:hypothetical protein
MPRDDEGVARTVGRGADPVDDPEAIVAGEDGESEDGEAPPQSSEEAIRVASMMGWKPKDQWRGDPQGWKSAEDFVAEVPVVLRHTREANSKLQSKVNRIVGEVAKLTDAQKRQVGEQAVQSLVDAAASGDLEAVKRIGDDILKTATPPAEHPSFTAFKERNEWYAEDPEARAYVAMLDKQYADGGPITDPDAHFAKIEKAVRKRFPEHFEASGEERPQEPAQPRARLVGRGGSVDRPKSGDLTPTTMNREQRRAAEEAQVSAESYCKSWNVWQARQGDQRRSA